MVYEEVQRLVEEHSAKLSAHVIDVCVRGSQQKAILEIFVDAEAGVTSEMCSAISQAVGNAIDERNLIKGSYQLVVSSPGIDRGLKFPWQYRKHIGRKLAVTLRYETGVTKTAGKLLSVDDEGMTLQVGNESLRVRFDAVHEAIVQAPW